MRCPTCHGENLAEADACSSCGQSLRSGEGETVPAGQARPRSASRRRRKANPNETGAANDRENPAAWRAYRLALWSLIPGVGLILGPAATVLGYRAMHGSGDASSRNRAKAAILFGVLITVTQWLGVALMIYGWNR